MKRITLLIILAIMFTAALVAISAMWAQAATIDILSPRAYLPIVAGEILPTPTPPAIPHPTSTPGPGP